MPPKVLVTAPYAMPVIDRYRAELTSAGLEVVIAPVRERLSESELLPLVTDIDAIICGDDQLTSAVIERAPRLKVISKWGTGIDSIDADAAARRGIRVCNTPNAFSEPVADSALGYMLLFARRLAGMDSDMRRGQWTKRQSFSLGEKTLGVIGVGNCGKAVIRRAAAFAMRMLGADPVPPPSDFIGATGMQMVRLDELLEQADFVTIHATLNSTSYHLINEAALARMRRNAYLINLARGPIVDESALTQALSSKRIAGAALDVFEIEPLPDDSPLRKLDNCWLAPHNANSSPTAAGRVHQNTIQNVIEAFR